MDLLDHHHVGLIVVMVHGLLTIALVGGTIGLVTLAHLGNICSLSVCNISILFLMQFFNV